MITLEEYSKINNLLASCNDMIDGKFILADYKIANILKNITESHEAYNLIANCMVGFSFEREFSRAQLRSASSSNKFVLPAQPEKILPFVFCVLVNINNKNLNFDLFLKEFYSSDQGRSFEYVNFAKQIILPFRNIIADYFDIPQEQLATLKTSKDKDSTQISTTNEKEKTITQNNESKNLKSDDLKQNNLKPNNLKPNNLNANSNFNNLKQIAEEKNSLTNKLKSIEEENMNNQPYEENLNNQSNLCAEANKNLSENKTGSEADNNHNINESQVELTSEKICKFFTEIKSICFQIKNEVDYDRKISNLKKEDIIYLCNSIIENCNDGELKNVIALLTAFNYVIEKVKMLKFFTHELKNSLLDLYN